MLTPLRGIALTPAQVSALAAECGQLFEHGDLIVWFVALTGVRAGELERLTLSDIRTMHSHLLVSGTKSRRRRDRRVDYGVSMRGRLAP